MNKEDREEFFQKLETSTKNNMNELHDRFLTSMEIQLTDVKTFFKIEVDRLVTKLEK